MELHSITAMLDVTAARSGGSVMQHWCTCSIKPLDKQKASCKDKSDIQPKRIDTSELVMRQNYAHRRAQFANRNEVVMQL